MDEFFDLMNPEGKATVVGHKDGIDAVLIDKYLWRKIQRFTPQQALKFRKTKQFNDLPSTVKNFINTKILKEPCGCEECLKKRKN